MGFCLLSFITLLSLSMVQGSNVFVSRKFLSLSDVATTKRLVPSGSNPLHNLYHYVGSLPLPYAPQMGGSEGHNAQPAHPTKPWINRLVPKYSKEWLRDNKWQVPSSPNPEGNHAPVNDVATTKRLVPSGLNPLHNLYPHVGSEGNNAQPEYPTKPWIKRLVPLYSKEWLHDNRWEILSGPNPEGNHAPVPPTTLRLDASSREVQIHQAPSRE